MPETAEAGKDGSMEFGSKDVAKAAIMLALSETREQEKELKRQYAQEGIETCGVDFGGEFTASVGVIIERAVVSAKREGLIGEKHAELGAVAGAAREAVAQIAMKSIGYNVGGKIGIARCGQHIAVAIYNCIGLLHLNDVAIGLGHRIV